MKFISSNDEQHQINADEELYNIHGIITDQEKNEKVFSKVIGNKYFIRTFNNVPFDPHGPESGRQIWNRTQLKSVSKITFEYYNTYLGTRNRLYLTKANRSYINV